MIGIGDIFSALSEALHSEFPEAEQYNDLCPEQFSRPALLVERVTNSREDVNKNTIRCTEYFTITCFCEVDERDNSSVLSLLSMQERVLNVFRGGYLTVGDRALKISSSGGGRDFDKAYADIQLEYSEEREASAEEAPVKSVTVSLKGE